ncbi:dead/deah box helicase [Lucifera butyrica]|uniref:Dead/deah box helicase n=1 Tax=Lucifera butyrica TaxID=1351585 RepID=A0A498R0R3_9FIRM|nr:CRISPR-associated helicase Cas3' [Lucifera butyrica]VBB06126.1 dead/deah box helicase [Lucifera butyrica]
MEHIFFAKSNPLQTIEEHTISALNLYEKLKLLYPDILSQKDWALLEDAILYHDLGKMDLKFQNRIREALKITVLRDEYQNIEPIPHNVLSCAFLDKRIMKKKHSNMGYEILVKAIYYHHHREFYLDEEAERYIETILPKYKEDFKWNYVILPDRLDTEVYTRIPFDSGKSYYNEMLRKYFIIKGLLNRIDYAASAGLESIEESCLEAGIGLSERVREMFKAKGHSLRPVQQYMLDNRERNLVVIAATGIGKTEASLLWLGDCKGFYTLPLKVSIDAIFKRIQKDINYTKVGLLHSDAISYHLQEQNDKDIDAAHNAYTCAKLLSKPLTITTIDQLFKFVFRYNGGEMPLATLAYSRLIIDEIQMYSQDLVAIILVAIKAITDLGGAFAIVTATFPPVLYNFMKKLEIPVKPPQKTFHSEFTKRHRIKLVIGADFDYDELLEMGSKKKVLIIANTVARAQRIYQNLKNQQGISVKLLHSSFIKIHRSILEDDIMQFATNSAEKRTPDTGIWVSTQIVEASLDIDFDVLFTEMCSIDSLLQRLGRIYRSRIYDLGEEPNIYILDGKNGRGKVVDPEIYDFSLKAVQKYDGQLLEESDANDIKQEMINMVYDPDNNPEILKSKYYQGIDERINMLMNLPMYEMDKKDVQKLFRAIETVTVIPEAIFDQMKQQGLIAQWQRDLENKEISNSQKQLIKNEILKYTINLSHVEQDGDAVKWDNELIYKKSKIYLYRGKYLFYEIQHTGDGLIRERSHNKSLQFASAEFL